jgi:chromosome segregation ATPase
VPLSESDIKNHSVGFIESIVKRMENVVQEGEKADSLMEQILASLNNHSTFVKKATVKIDAMVNCIKNTNNYLFESLNLNNQSSVQALAQASQSSFKKSIPDHILAQRSESKQKLRKDLANYQVPFPVNSKADKKEEGKSRSHSRNHSNEQNLYNKKSNSLEPEGRLGPALLSLQQFKRNLNKQSLSSPPRNDLKIQNDIDTQAMLEKYKSKAAKHKNQVRILLGMYTEKEQENERLKIQIEESKIALTMVCEEAENIQKSQTEGMMKKIEGSLGRVNKLQRIVNSMAKNGISSRSRSRSPQFTNLKKITQPGIKNSQPLLSSSSEPAQVQQRELSSLQATITSLKKDLKQAQSNSLLTLDKNSTLEEEIVALRQKANVGSESNKKLSESNKDKERLVLENEQLRNQNEELQKIVQEANSELQQAYEAIQSLEEQKEGINEAAIDEKISEAVENLKKLYEEKMSNLNTNLKEAQKELENSNKSSLQNIASLKTQLEKEAKARQESEAKLKSASSESTRYSDQIQELQSQISKRDERIANFEKQINGLDTVSKDYAKTKSELEAAKKSLDQKEKDVKQMEDQHSSSLQKINLQHQQELMAKSKEIDSLKTQIEVASQGKHGLQALRSEIEVKNKEIATLVQQIDALDKDLNLLLPLRKQNEQLEREVELAKKQLKEAASYQDRVKVLEAEVEDRNKQIETFGGQIKKIEADLNLATKESQDAKNASQRYEQLLADKDRQIERERATVVAMDEENRRKTEELSTKVADLTKTNELYTAQINKMSQSKDLENSKKITVYDEEIKNLKESLIQEQEDSKKLAKALGDALKKADDAEQENLKLQKEFETRMADHIKTYDQTLKKRLDDMYMDYEDKLKKARMDSEDAVHKKHDEIKSLKSKLIDWENIAKELREENVSLKEKQGSNAVLEDQVLKLKQENSKLKDQQEILLNSQQGNKQSNTGEEVNEGNGGTALTAEQLEDLENQLRASDTEKELMDQLIRSILGAVGINTEELNLSEQYDELIEHLQGLYQSALAAEEKIQESQKLHSQIEALVRQVKSLGAEPEVDPEHVNAIHNFDQPSEHIMELPRHSSDPGDVIVQIEDKPELRRTDSEYKEELEQANAKASQFEAELHKAIAKRDDLARELELKTELADNTLKETNSKFEVLIKQIEASHKEAVAKLNADKKKVEDKLADTIKDFEVQLQAKNKELSTLNLEKSSLEEDLHILKEKLENDSNKIAFAEKSLKDVDAERKQFDERDKANQSEFDRLSSLLLKAKEDNETLKGLFDKLKNKYNDLEASSQKQQAESQQQYNNLKEKHDKIALQSEKDQVKFNQSLQSKLEEINNMYSENEALKQKVLIERDRAKELNIRLDEMAKAKLNKSQEKEPENQGQVKPVPVAVNKSQDLKLNLPTGQQMDPIRETEEYDESEDKRNTGRAMGQKVETLQATIRELRQKIATYENIFKPSKNIDPTKVESTNNGDEMPPETRIIQMQNENLELREYIGNALQQIADVQKEFEEVKQRELLEKEAMIAKLEEELEEVESKYLREIGEKSRVIHKLNQDLEERITAKEREIFYLKKEQESVNVAKNEEIEHLKKITTESSKERQESQPNRSPEISQPDEHIIGHQRARSSHGADTSRREKERENDELIKLRYKYNKLVSEVEEMRRRYKRSYSNLENLTHMTSDAHISLQETNRVPKVTSRKDQAPGELGEGGQANSPDQLLERENNMLREQNNILRIELEKQKEVQKQILDGYEYIRTESDYRITDQDIENMKKELSSKNSGRDSKALYNDLVNLVKIKFDPKKEITPENIIHTLSKNIDKLILREQNSDIVEKYEEQQIEIQQLRKQTEELKIQNAHLKDKTKSKDQVPAPVPSQSLGTQEANTQAQQTLNHISEIINTFLTEVEMKTLDKLEPAKLKEALTTILKMRRKVLLELKIKEDMIEELKLSSLKVSSERGESPHSANPSSEEYNKMKELLAKVHSSRKKYETVLAENEKLQIERENLAFEVEDLKQYVLIKEKGIEALEIQVKLLKEQMGQNTSMEDAREHIKGLFGQLFRTFTETKDLYQANHVLETLTSMIGYSAEEKKQLFENIKKSKVFDKILKKK